jgi:hypothetical protein
MKRMIRDVAFVSILAAGAAALLSQPATAGPRVCPQIYAPVICDNGRVYPNQCEADRHHARNCVPYNGL